MTSNTVADLQTNTIEKIQHLIRANIDSSRGFRESAEQIEDARIANLFRVFAEQRENIANELQQFVEVSGETADDDGSCQ